MMDKKRTKTHWKKKNSPRLEATVGIGAVLNPLVKRTFGRRGFQNSAILTDWESIVGKHLATYSKPDRIMYQRGSRSEGTLHIKIFGAMATELDHQAGLIVEKINQYMGYNAVAKLKLHHTQDIPVDNQAIKVKPKKNTALNSVDENKLMKTISNLEEGELKEQLIRIGRHIYKK